MSKKINLAVKPTKEDVTVARSPAPYYPSLYIDKDLPIDGADVGKTLTATVSVKVKSYTENQKDKGKPKHSYQLDVLDIDFAPEHITASPDLDRKLNM